MNEQSSMMNQQQMMNPPPPTGMMSAMSQKPPPQLMNPQQSQPQPPPPQMLMNPPPQMMNRGYGMWGHPPPSQPMDLQLNYQNPNPKTQGPGGFGKLPSKHHLGPRNNWKGKKVNKVDMRKDLGRRMEIPMSIGGGSSGNIGIAGNMAGGGFNMPTMGIPGSGVGGTGGGFNPPSLKDLQYQNRVKTRRYFPKNHYNKKNMGKFAPRNTSSFIIRAKKSGGIADLVSPSPVTPSVLPTPVFSPSREILVDMAKEEWGVDGYGSMKGLIRLRSQGGDGHDDDDEDEGGSSGSDVEEHVEVERRLDHDLSRFEMIYPNYGTVGGVDFNNVLENRVDDQDSHIAQLEEENLILKERLFLMERELGDLRRRLQSLERQSHDGNYGNEEVVENLSENESDSRGGSHSMEDNEGLGGGSHSMEDKIEGSAEENEDTNLEFQGQEDNSNQGAAKFEENNAKYNTHKEEQPSNHNATKFEENNADYIDHKKEQDDIKDFVLESAEQNSEDGKKNGGVPVDCAVGQVPEENKDEDVPNNDNGSDSDAQGLGETGAGEDSCMHDVSIDGK